MHGQLKLPRVVLLIETSRSYGRGLVEGIGRYVGMHGPWAIDFQERGLTDAVPSWLKKWPGDGIISRTVRRADIDRLLSIRLPVVELFADPALGLPRVYADQKAVGELAAKHFLDRGLERTAFFTTECAWWIESRCDAFARMADQEGLACEVFEPKGIRKNRNRIDQQKEGVILEPDGVIPRQSTDILALADPDVAEAVRIIREHACRGLKVSQVAEGVGLSRRALEQRFRRALGRTPKEEISRIQIERARYLLRQTAMPIERVAGRSGFRSFKYFARAFRRVTGTTPRAYRQAHLIPGGEGPPS